MTQYVIRDHARGRACYWSGTEWGALSTALVIEDEGHTVFPIGDLGETAEYETLPAAAGSHLFQTIAAAGVIVGRIQVHADPEKLGRLVSEEAQAKLALDTPEDFNAGQIADEADTAHEQMLRVSDVTTALRLNFDLKPTGETKIADLITPERPASAILAAIEDELMIDTSDIDLADVEDIDALAGLLEDAPALPTP